MVSTQKMTDYLKIAVKIESQAYALSKVKADINNELQRLNSVQYYDDMDCALNDVTFNQMSVKSYIKDNYEGLFKSILKFRFLGSKLLSVVALLIFLPLTIQVFGFSMGVFGELFTPSGNKLGTVNLIVGLATVVIFYTALSLIYRQICYSGLKKDFNEQRFKHNKKREASEALYSKNQKLIKVYTVQLNAVNKEIRETLSLRNNFYAEDILPPQYRNLTATATMYPWLLYGICTEVYGHGGVFDTYETHLKQNIIIGNLQQLNSKMDQALKNQRILIEEVRRGNEISSQILTETQRIGDDVSQIRSDVSDIKESSRITAMAASRTAMYQEYLYWQS